MLYSIYESELDYVDMKQMELKLDEMMEKFTFVHTQSYLAMQADLIDAYNDQKSALDAIQSHVLAFENQFIIGDE